jgi:hypothetical protein
MIDISFGSPDAPAERPRTARGETLPPRPSSWVALTRPEVGTADDVLVPDLAAWRAGPQELLDGTFLAFPPDWICEIGPGSPRDEDRERFERYAHLGVAHAWVLDGDARRLDVYRNEGGRWLLTGAYAVGAVVRAEPFGDVELEIASLCRRRPC